MVTCKKCMMQYDEKYDVCPRCGTPYEIPHQTMPMAEIQPKKKCNKGIIIGIISVVVVLVIGAVILIATFSNTNSSDVLEEQISLGEKYLTEENYEEAIVAFKKAIEIEPNDPKLYIQLADAYIGKGDMDSAILTLQDGYERTHSANIKIKLDELTSSESEFSFEESSYYDYEESSDISKSKEEQTALQEYSNDMPKSGSMELSGGSILSWSVSQSEVSDLNNDGSYELIVQYQTNSSNASTAYPFGVLLKIFKYENNQIKEYKTFSDFDVANGSAAMDYSYFMYVDELYIDKETNNYIILTRKAIDQGTSPIQYKYIYTANLLSQNGFTKLNEWSLECKSPFTYNSEGDWIVDSSIKKYDIAVFAENEYHYLVFNVNEQSVNKTEYIDNIDTFNSSASIVSKYDVVCKKSVETYGRIYEDIYVKNLKYITYNELVEEYP